jgi:hypothetical protein
MSTLSIDGITFTQVTSWTQVTLGHIVARKLLYIEDGKFYFVIAFQSFLNKDSNTIDFSKSLNIITISLDYMRDGKAQTGHLTDVDPNRLRTLPKDDFYSAKLQAKKLGEIKVLLISDLSRLYIPGRGETPLGDITAKEGRI